MKPLVLVLGLACIASAQLLRGDKMNLGRFNPETKHYEKKSLQHDGHDRQQHTQHSLLGQDGHDRQHHARTHLLGQDGHDQQHHRQRPLLGQGDHDLQPHHRQRPLLGQDDHDLQRHEQRPLLGQDDHDLQRHERPLLGTGNHDMRTHRKPLLGGDDHDKREHKKKSGKKYNKRRGKKHILGQGDHDYKKHGKKFGGGIHDLTHAGMFKKFMKQHKKSYADQAEYKKRFSIFRQNMKKVHVLQQNERGTAKYGITKFADLTEQEYRKMLGLRPDLKPELSSMKPAEIPNIEVPAEFDWRDKGVVTPVKNQGMCGSCWAFSVTGNVEGQWALKHHHLYSLSEQELVDCDTTDDGCNGGMPENAYEAINKLGGLETETDYPYDAADEQCHFNKSLVKVTVNGSVELPKDETALAKWLVKNGPISIGINANALQFYSGGVSHPLKFLCNPENLDHGMLIVGFGVHTTKYLHRKQPYWIIKNSWGTDWGEQGYYRVYRGDSTCGVNQMATSAIVP